ncbi:MAG: hypothetical protein ABI566_13415 [Pseudolysinimonas sp.]
MATLDDVSRIAATLPGSDEKRSGGGLAWFVRRKPYAWESMPWPSEPDNVRELVATELCIGVRLPDDNDKRALVQGWPDVFVGRLVDRAGPTIVIRLGSVAVDHLAELVTESWRTQAPKYLIAELDSGRERPPA